MAFVNLGDGKLLFESSLLKIEGSWNVGDDIYSKIVISQRAAPGQEWVQLPYCQSFSISLDIQDLLPEVVLTLAGA